MHVTQGNLHEQRLWIYTAISASTAALTSTLRIRLNKIPNQLCYANYNTPQYASVMLTASQAPSLQPCALENVHPDQNSYKDQR